MITTAITTPSIDATSTSKSSQHMSRRAAKKEQRKHLKAEKKRLALEAYLQDVKDPPRDNNPVKSEETILASVGGKASRARLARQRGSGLMATFHPSGDNEHDVELEWEQHRPQGGAPILSQTLPQHMNIVEYLERREQEMRIDGRGNHMKERLSVKVDCHGSMESCTSTTQENNEHGLCDLSSCGARGNLCFVSWSSLTAFSKPFSLSTIVYLDIQGMSYGIYLLMH